MPDDAPILLPKRVLIVRPSALGDVCRTVPLLASLKAHWPQAEIDWLVQDGFAAAISAHPALTAVVPFPRMGFKQWYRPRAARSALAWVGALAERKYDVVIDAQGLFRSGLFAWATRAKVRVGFRNARELGWLGCNIRVEAPRAMHAVDRMLALLKPLGVPPLPDMRLYVPDDDARAAAEDPRLAGRFALLAPTSRWPGKRWPIVRFANLARRLLAEGVVERIVVVGGRSERDHCEPLSDLARADARATDLVGTTTVGGLMAASQRAAVVIANDSAALHMAVGFDRPLVALYGPTHISRVGPYGRSASVIQHVHEGERLDHKDDMRGTQYMERITVDEVVQAAKNAVR